MKGAAMTIEMNICECSGVKPIGTGLQRCGINLYIHMSHPSQHSALVGECMCGAYQENRTGLEAWLLQWRGSVGGILLL